MLQTYLKDDIIVEIIIDAITKVTKNAKEFLELIEHEKEEFVITETCFRKDVIEM